MQEMEPSVGGRQAKLPFAGFRPDIQGLRAVAVGVVLLYHANAPYIGGGFVGVDVFFVISGYLITGLLLREALRNGRIDLADFYARRARRILPAATIVLVATLVLTVAFLPKIRWQSIGVEAAGAAVYVVNWIFAGGTDYLNADVAASPIQHFWTLSVEEQFYIVWPLILIALLTVVARGSTKRLPDGDRIMRYAGVGVLVILVPSLAWSVYYTSVSPAPAYFVTTTRLWELAIGAALAVFARYVVRIPVPVGYALGWLGLAGILAASVLYTSAAPAFPGAAALLPTLSAAAIIAGGMNGRAEKGVGALLSLRPMRWIGDISYSLYLWHWPLIVVATYLLGGELRFRYGIAVVLVSILLSWLSYKLIENPFRDWERLKRSVKGSLWAGAALVAVTLVVSTGTAVTPSVIARAEAPQISEGQRFGAEALTDDFSDDSLASFTDAGAPVDKVEGGFTPAATNARDDNPVVYDNGCQRDQDVSAPKGCEFGESDTDTTVVLTGDSHAASLVPTMRMMAEQHGWELITQTKSACSFNSANQSYSGGPYPECDAWNKAALDQIIAEDPDLVITINSQERRLWDGNATVKGEAHTDQLVAGYAESWSALNDAGIPVVVLKDTPIMNSDVPECVSANEESLSKCATPRDKAIDVHEPYEELAAAAVEREDIHADVSVIDINNWVCPNVKSCSAIVGNVLVWRDKQHLTATYAKTLVKPLEATLRQTKSAKTLFQAQPYEAGERTAL